MWKGDEAMSRGTATKWIMKRGEPDMRNSDLCLLCI